MTMDAVFSSEFLWISKNTFSTEHLPLAASKTFVFFIFVSMQRGHDNPRRSDVLSLQITINFSLSSILFNFDNVSIEKYQKSFKVLFFFSVIFPLLMYIFFKKSCSNLACESDETWRRPTFSQLNGWGYGWGLKYTIQFSHFHLIGSI